MNCLNKNGFIFTLSLNRINPTTDLISIYLNGESIHESEVSSFGVLNFSDEGEIGSGINIAAAPQVEWDYLQGSVDNVQIWNIYLNSEQINQYMICPPVGNEAGLVGYWNFEEGEGETVIDLSENGNNGTNNGATYSTDVPEQSCQLTSLNGCDSVAVLDLTITQPDTSFTEVTACESYEWNGETYNESGTYSYSGNSVSNNYSMSFDGGNDYVNLGSFTNYNLNNSSTSISVMLKAFVSGFGYQGSESYIFGTPMFAGNNDRGFRIETKANNTFGIAAGGNSDIVYTYSANKQANVWYDIAMVLDQSQDIIFLYVDGVLESQVSISQIGTINNAYNLNIGAFENGSWLGNLFSGSVDNISIWNTVLTQQEIQEYINCPPNGNEIGLVGYWNFEEGEGNTAYDLTGNGNDGIINGATYSSDVPEHSCQLINSNGCDSVVTLDLTILDSTTGIDVQEHCDSYTWIDGETYTSSNNTATHTLTNVARMR